jgi:hypothetical protein
MRREGGDVLAAKENRSGVGTQPVMRFISVVLPAPFGPISA